jgi:MFS family permease
MLSNGWYRIISLAVLQGAISLTWLIYNIYLPKLLISYGFSPSLAISLIVIENAIAFVLEPLFGSFSDRTYRWIATKFGFVSLGVIITSTISILIPTVIVFHDFFRAIEWILPGILIAWAMAMTVFRSPAISLIGRYAFASELPIAMSFLTLVGGFVGAISPISQDFILSLGAPLAFSIASIGLLAGAVILRYFEPPIVVKPQLEQREPIVPMKVALLIGTGFGVAWGSRCLLLTIPKILKLHVPQVSPVTTMVIISLAIAVSALPSGLFANKYGNRQTMLLGIVATSISLLTIVFLPTIETISIAILLIMLCFSSIANGSIPFAINLFPANLMGLAVGLYFAGFSAGMSAFTSMFNPVTNLTPVLGATFGSIGLILAGICIWSSFKFDNRPSKRTTAPTN